MKILLLHPEDRPWRGEWATARWDLIVDLGFAGPEIYADWSTRSGARILSLHQFAGESDSYRWVNEALEAGRGRLLDRMGLDWWEIIAVWSYQKLQLLYLLRRLRRECGPAPVEWYATQYHAGAALLQQGFCESVHYFRPRSTRPLSALSRMLSSARRLRASQIVEIAFDKWDARYSLRRRLAARARCQEPVWLLPSAYSNVTRTLLAYAAQLPNRRFLLAATRNSGTISECPPNVNATSLAAYAAPRCETQPEIGEMLTVWQRFSKTLNKSEELKQAQRAGIFDFFPTHLTNGLCIRDAWKALMQHEPVEGVLCGDDLNYYTRLPLLLAKRMHRGAIYCYHGALDGGLLFKQAHADLHLVKGEMERDYMAWTSSIPPEKVIVAAPGPVVATTHERQNLVFFSEPYENSGGRAEEIYRELLPRICAIAQHMQRKVVVKLHPFESEKARRRIIGSVLSTVHRNLVQVASRTPIQEVISKAWCGIGVGSSVAVECIMNGVPYFLCGWLDCSGFGYVRQLAKFGAGRLLHCPEDIGRIPDMVSVLKLRAEVLEKLWSPAEPQRLDEIIFGHQEAYAQCAC